MASQKLSALVSLAGGQVPTDLIYVDDLSAGAAGSKSSTFNDAFSIITRNITDGAVRFGGFAAPTPAASQGSIYYDSATNRFKFSENNAAYKNLGDVTGPGVIVDESIARFDGTTGKIIQSSVVTITDLGAFANALIQASTNVLGAVTMTLTGDGMGDVYYRDAGGLLTRLGIGTAAQVLTVAGGLPSWATPAAAVTPGGANTTVQYNNGGVFGGVTGFVSDGTNVVAGDGNLRAISPLISTSIDDANGNIIIGLLPAASAVDRISIANAAAGNSPTFSTTGASADITMTFSPKGAGLNAFTKNLLFNVGSGALDNLIYVGAVTAVAVNASFGFFVAGVGSDEAAEGPYFLARGNTFTALGNQRGSMFFAAGGAGTPTQNEGSINFFTNAPEQQRARIARAGSGLPLLALTQANTGEIGFDVNNPSGSTVPIATFSVNTVPFVVFDSTANAYFGNGIVNAAPANYILQATGGSGTNIAGANLDLAGGKGTGLAVPGFVGVRYPLIDATGTTLQSLSTARFPVITSLYTNIGTGTAINNTTAETSLFTGLTGSAGSTATIEAGISRQGTIYRIRAFGNLQTTGTPTLQLLVRLGGIAGTVIFNTGAATMATVNGRFQIVIDLLVTAIGAGGNISAFGQIEYSSVTGGAATINTNVGANTTAVDLSASQAIEVSIVWGTANASNSIQVFGLSIGRER
jgi:hypothetical protein